MLFEGSVKDNLLLGKPDATEQEIIAATKAANAHEFITKLSNGYGKPILFVCDSRNSIITYHFYRHQILTSV